MAIEQCVETPLLEALRAAEGVEADGDEERRVHPFSSGVPLAGEVIAQDDASQRDPDRHHRGRRVEPPDVLEHAVQVVVLGGAVGAGRRDGVPAPAAEVEDDAARADLATGHVDKALDVLRLRVSREAGQEETDGRRAVRPGRAVCAVEVQPIEALKWRERRWKGLLVASPGLVCSGFFY